MTDKVAPEKISLLKAYGAEVVVCPVTAGAGGPAELLLRRRAAHRGAKGRSGPTSTPTRPTRFPTRGPPGPSCGRRRPGGSPTSSPGAGTCGSITGRRPLPQGPEPRHPHHRRRPRGLRVLGRLGPAVPRRGRRRGLLPATWTTRPVRRRHRDQRRGELPDRPPRVRGRGHPHRRVGRDGRRRRPSRSPSRQPPTTSSSSSTPTPAAATCHACSTTTGWPTSASSTSATSASAPCSTPATRATTCSTSTPTRRSARPSS